MRRTSLMTALALTLVLAAFAAPPARAQEPAPAPGGEQEEGRPLDGYLATGILAGFAMFVVGKTARR
jgi:hypothetical protein